MDPKTHMSKNGGCQEAETVSTGDSEQSSLLEFFDFKVKENSVSEKIFKLKNLAEDLETSFTLSNNNDNNLLLRCALLESENYNLKRQINAQNITIHNLLCKNGSKGLCVAVDKSESKDSNSGLVERGESYISGSGNFTDSTSDEDRTIGKLNSSMQETIIHLRKELKDREHTITLLCEKYLYLKNNKNRMEISLKKKISSLERLLNVSYGILHEVQNEVETKIDKYLSKTKNTYEALFFQEKWRNTKLTYESMRLQRELNRLEIGRKMKDEIFIDAQQQCDMTNDCATQCSNELLTRTFNIN